MPHDKFLGCLLGGAIGDALGGAIEFYSIAAIRDTFGSLGVTGYAPAYGLAGGAITDDTQMTLFTLEGLLEATRSGADPVAAVADAYQRWRGTQTTSVPAENATGLLAEPVLYARRAPGMTCLSALDNIAHGADIGTPGSPINNSKGCGGVMRAAPAGMFAADAVEAFGLGAHLAAITHGHPSGYLSAGALAAIVREIFHGATLDEALDTAEDVLVGWAGHAETLGALREARFLARAGRPTPETVERLGGGWTGEEALAIGVYAALAATTVTTAILVAVNHSGDSDSTGSICGNILGALHGSASLPAAWVDGLEGRDLIVSLARQIPRAA